MAQNATPATPEAAARLILAQPVRDREMSLASLRAIILNRREGVIADAARAILDECERLLGETAPVNGRELFEAIQQQAEALREIFDAPTGNRRFGKARGAVVGCKCTDRFTCGACLNASISPRA